MTNVKDALALIGLCTATLAVFAAAAILPVAIMIAAGQP